MKKRIVAIDFGLKRFGLAISDASHIVAFPWTTVSGGEAELFKVLETRKSEIGKIIIGLPLLMNGTKGDMALLVEAFAKKIQEKFLIPVELIDERLSSKQADVSLRSLQESRKQRTAKTDQTAAMIILETFLSSPKKL